jgi:hypothetical protein
MSLTSEGRQIYYKYSRRYTFGNHTISEQLYNLIQLLEYILTDNNRLLQDIKDYKYYFTIAVNQHLIAA